MCSAKMSTVVRVPRCFKTGIITSSFVIRSSRPKRSPVLKASFPTEARETRISWADHSCSSGEIMAASNCSKLTTVGKMPAETHEIMFKNPWLHLEGAHMKQVTQGGAYPQVSPLKPNHVLIPAQLRQSFHFQSAPTHTQQNITYLGRTS